jgi:hypothetical protein
MEDPVSGQDYQPTIDGLKQWAANEWRYGIPGVYALAGFNCMIGVAALATKGWAVITGADIGPVLWMSIGFLGLLCGFGGWQTGYEEAQNYNEVPEYNRFQERE